MQMQQSEAAEIENAIKNADIETLKRLTENGLDLKNVCFAFFLFFVFMKTQKQKTNANQKIKCKILSAMVFFKNLKNKFWNRKEYQTFK